jgi:hypothetical protein
VSEKFPQIHDFCLRTYIGLAEETRESGRTRAHETVDAIRADATVLAGHATALVDIGLAEATGKFG